MIDATKEEFESIASRALVLIDDITGLKKAIQIRIGLPYWIEPGRIAACAVCIDGVLGRREDIRGEDLLEAIHSAIQFADRYLRGGIGTSRVVWPNGESYDQAP